MAAEHAANVRKPIKHLRWWIGGLLFASTVVNYIDRQTLSVLAPHLKTEYGWSNTDFATIVIAFRIAYAIMQSLGGRVVDWLGTRRGLTITVAWYTVAAALHSFAAGLWSFRVCRFLLGIGEAPNWPAATKAVSEWFPARERGWAVALFDSGSSIGAAVAPALVVWLLHAFGSWRPVFVVTALLGCLWLAAWRMFYYAPELHPRLSAEELRLIRESDLGADQRVRPERESIAAAQNPEQARGGHMGPPLQDQHPGWVALLKLPQTWGIILARLLDPYWFLVADWFAILLVSKGYKLEETLVGFWVPFLAADLGNFFGGGLSSFFLRRGWRLGMARKAVFLICGPLMLLLAPAAYTGSFALLITYFGAATFGYAACSTIFLTLPSDLYPSAAVATVSGLSGTGAGIFTIMSTYAVGRITDRYGFEPVLVGASLVPLVATTLLFLLVRNTRHTRAGLVREI